MSDYRSVERTLRHQADRFGAEGMVSLFRPTKHQETDDHRALPPPIRQAIVDLRAEYADLSLHELVQIISIQFSRRPSRATVKQVLADGPKPSIKERRCAKSADISEVCSIEYDEQSYGAFALDQLGGDGRRRETKS